MVVTTELLKKGKEGYMIADLDIVQEGSMTIRVGPGPVIDRGRTCDFQSVSDYVVEEALVDRWIALWIVRKVSTDTVILFVDEGEMGSPPYQFHGSDYEPLFRLGEVRVAGGAANLDAATLFMRRWVVQEV